MIDMVAGEHRSDEMLALNPIGRMPVLVDDDQVVYGSLAIGQYAAQSAPGLLPDSDLASFHVWLGIIMTDLAPAFSVQYIAGVLSPSPDNWTVGFYVDAIRRILTATDDHLACNEFIHSSGYSLADIMLYPMAVTSAKRLDGGLENWPNLVRWADVVGAREPVIRGMAASCE